MWRLKQEAVGSFTALVKFAIAASRLPMKQLKVGSSRMDCALCEGDYESVDYQARVVRMEPAFFDAN